MDISSLHQLFLETQNISTDTRKIIPHSIFFALKGENFDANQFAQDALEKGASYAVIDNPEYLQDSNSMILVKDVLETLQELAHYHRHYLKLPIIGLTGSNGKTTTKELINSVLSKKYKTIATQGNLNNHIGVPLTLLSMNPSTEIGIVEMGANHFGEIARLCEIASPNYGYITNFGKAHLEGFGSLEGVVKAKSELYQFLFKNNGTVFVNPNDEKQLKLTENQKRILLENVSILENESEYLSVRFNNTDIYTHLVGNYNLPNIAAAISIGQYFGVDDLAIKEAIESFTPDNKRSQLIDKQYCKIILDAYNANPTSMQAALENFGKSQVDGKIVILGDMFELGNHSEEEHQKIAEIAQQLNFNKIYLIGERFHKINALNSLKFKSFEDFKESFDKLSFSDKTILIKGSRGMVLERVLDLF